MTTAIAAPVKFTFEGRTFELTTYVDPYPGAKGSDRVDVECGVCRDGVYTAPSGFTWRRGGVETSWCFKCMGSNKRNVSVSSQRRLAKIDAMWAEYAEVFEAERIAREEEANRIMAEAQFAADWDAAHAEQERRASMVGGFIAEVGAKVKGLRGTVKVAKFIRSEQYNRPNRMFIVIETEDGKIAMTSGSGDSLFSIERGDRVEIVSATVKDHDSFRGQDQTVLFRTKLERVEEVEAVV